MDEKFAVLEKYSFWGDRSPEVGYVRTEYLERMGGIDESRLITVLTGQRRSGKSYILRQIAKSLIDSGVPRNNIFFLNKEFLAFDFVRTFQDLEDLFQEYKRRRSPKGRIFIFLDEVQDIEGWERFVNSYSQDYTSEYRLFISGSNSKMLSSELSTLLTGRYLEFSIFPFSYSEYTDTNGLETGRDSYVKYMNTGGLPELGNLSGEEARRQYIEGLKNTILLKDIIQRHQVRDTNLLESLFAYLVNNASNLVSVQNIVNYMSSKGRKTGYETVSQYIDYLTETFIVRKAERYDLRGREILNGTAKYYSNDQAFHNYLFGGYGYGAGYMLENMVYLDLRRAGYNVYVGVLRSQEIDFIAEKGDRRIYVQVCYMLLDDTTINREYSPLRSIPDNYEKYVVSIDDISLPVKDGIRNIPAWNLKKYI